MTIYVGPQILKQMAKELIEKKPRRVIFNPGTECEEVEAWLKGRGIIVQRACTLVLLNTNQFDET